MPRIWSIGWRSSRARSRRIDRFPGHRCSTHDHGLSQDANRGHGLFRNAVGTPSMRPRGESARGRPADRSGRKRGRVMDLTGWRRTCRSCWSSRPSGAGSIPRRMTSRHRGRRCAGRAPAERERLRARADRDRHARPRAAGTARAIRAQPHGRGTCGSGWTGRSWSTWRHRRSRPRSGWRTAASARRTSRWRIPTRWKLYRRTFDRGPIGLGVNGLDRSPPAHYVVFIRPLEGREAGGRAGRPIVSLEEGWRDSWREVVAGPRVSAAFDVSRPFATPPRRAGSARSCSSRPMPRRTRRCSRRAASGRRMWPPLRNRTRWRSRFGADPGRELVWTWRTSPEVVSSAVRIVRATADARCGAAGRRCPHRGGRLVLRRRRRTCSMIRSSAATGWPWADSSPTPSIDTPSAMGRRGMGTVERREDRAGGRSVPLRFLYLGDAQTGLEGWGRLLGGCDAPASRGMDFVVLAGDLVDRGNERTNWDHFFLRAAPVSSTAYR